MKAKIKPRIQLENRESLADSIPLSTPWVIFVDPSDRCNFNCKMCPTGNYKLMREVGRSFKFMSLDLYIKIINDIYDGFDKPIKVLRLYKDGEPLLHPQFPKMVELAKLSGCCERVDTTTNGSLLNPTLNRNIVESGLDRIHISVEGVNEEQYKDFSNYKIDYGKFVDNISDLYDNKKQLEIIIKINGDVISEEDKLTFFDLFGDICDGISIEHTMNCWNNFNMDGLNQNEEVGIYGQPIEEVDICPYIFYSMSINSDGSVSLCFLDWNRKLIIGDVKSQSVKEIWNSSELWMYQQDFLIGLRKNHPICKNCSQLSHGMAVNLDSKRNILYKELWCKKVGMSDL